MDPRQHLLGLLERHAAHDEREAEMLTRLKGFVQGSVSALDWRNAEGHVTGSAWVLDPGASRVLLTFHSKLGRWLQLGGHVEDDETVLEAAVREAREESGIPGIRIGSAGEAPGGGIFDVDIHLIPARGTRTAHWHYDVRFLCVGPAEAPVASAESREVAWVELEDVTRLNADESMRRMVEKTLHHRSTLDRYRSA
ncbi:MAG: NUDIX hydrolase [Bryobacteraceae bacterium]